MLLVSSLEIIFPSAGKFVSLTYRLVEFKTNVLLALETLIAESSAIVSLVSILGRPASANVQVLSKMAKACLPKNLIVTLNVLLFPQHQH